MKKSIINDIILTILLIVILCACYFPIMPGGMSMMIYSLLVLVFGIFAFFIWREKPQDERERSHHAFASRMAFTFGTGVLVVAIVYQGLVMYHVDPWIFSAFIAMIVGKVGGRVWAHYYC